MQDSSDFSNAVLNFKAIHNEQTASESECTLSIVRASSDYSKYFQLFKALLTISGSSNYTRLLELQEAIGKNLLMIERVVLTWVRPFRFDFSKRASQ